MLVKDSIKFLVIHCSDTNDEENINASDIHKMHLGFGWDGIGYHKIIQRSGKIENGRPEYWVGAHVKGFNNFSLGVCMIGRNNFLKEQFVSLEKVIKKWKFDYPNSEIIGHCDFKSTEKTCPNFDVTKWVNLLKL